MRASASSASQKYNSMRTPRACSKAGCPIRCPRSRDTLRTVRLSSLIPSCVCQPARRRVIGRDSVPRDVTPPGCGEHDDARSVQRTRRGFVWMLRRNVSPDRESRGGRAQVDLDSGAHKGMSNSARRGSRTPRGPRAAAVRRVGRARHGPPRNRVRRARRRRKRVARAARQPHASPRPGRHRGRHVRLSSTDWASAPSAPRTASHSYIR
jgi:hypothetical protein